MNRSKEEIIALAERYLERHQPSDYRINILREGVTQVGDDWWSVVVEPSREDVRSYDYLARVNKATNDIEQAESILVLFTNALPQHAE